MNWFQTTIISLLVSGGVVVWALWNLTNSPHWNNVQHYVATQEARETPTVTSTATSTTTPTVTPALTSTPVVYHRVTHYDAGWDGGLLGCGSDVYGSYDHTDPTTAASRTLDCGTRVKVCANGCQVVIIKDRCGACALDLSTAAWENIGQADFATVDVLP